MKKIGDVIHPKNSITVEIGKTIIRQIDDKTLWIEHEGGKWKGEGMMILREYFFNEFNKMMGKIYEKHF